MNSTDVLHENNGAVDPDTLIYERTAKGMAASRDPSSDLPRMMKTLLMAVDGKTTVGMFQKLLPNFGDVGALLDGLQANGLVTPRDAGSRAASKLPLRVVPLRDTAPPPPAPAARDSRLARPAPAPTPSRFTPEAGWRSTAAAPSTLQQSDGASFDPYRALVPNTLSGTRYAIAESSRVRDARSLMTNFLFQYRADVAMEVTLTLERLETTEQMLSSLDDYKRLVASAGRAAVEHLAEVRRILAD
jgi:hypothetical protein